MEVARGTASKRSPAGARRPRHTATAEALGRRIVGGTLKPGAVLPNADLLAREYKVSRPALREAIKLLAGKGLLEMAPRRGTVVRPRDQWNRLDDDVLTWESGEAATMSFINDLFELRRMIEPEAAALAAQRASSAGIEAIGEALLEMSKANFTSIDSIRADLDFHRAILTHSGNDFLATFGPAIEASMTVTFSMQRRRSADSKRFIQDHALVYQAIRNRDPDAARQASLALLTPAEGDALAGMDAAGVGVSVDLDAADLR